MTNTNLSGQIDLLALVGAQNTTVDGRNCIVIPVENNPSIFVTSTKSGAARAYLDIVIRESPNNQFGNTHFVKANVSKSNRERLGISRDGLSKYTPIIGNLKPFDFQGQAPAAAQQPGDDDLPADDFRGF